MSAGTICPGQDILESRLDNYAGSVVSSELYQFFAEPIPVADDCVNEVLGSLSLNRDHMLQTGEGVIPRR